jgi:hypothetical protein
MVFVHSAVALMALDESSMTITFNIHLEFLRAADFLHPNGLSFQKKKK